jgi:hypothetical protein
LSSRGIFTLSFTSRGEHSLMFRRMKGLHTWGITSPLGANFTSGGQLHPWGPTSPLGATSPLGDNFTPGGQLKPWGSNFAPGPGGEVKNWPLVTMKLALACYLNERVPSLWFFADRNAAQVVRPSIHFVSTLTT